MATAFPYNLDVFANPSGSISLGSANESLKHSTQHRNINDAMAAVQSHIGISGSTNPETINFRLNQLKQDVEYLSNLSGSADVRQVQFLNNGGPFEGFGETLYFKDTIYNGYFVDTVVWYGDFSKTKKVFDVTVILIERDLRSLA